MSGGGGCLVVVLALGTEELFEVVAEWAVHTVSLVQRKVVGDGGEWTALRLLRRGGCHGDLATGEGFIATTVG